MPAGSESTSWQDLQSTALMALNAANEVVSVNTAAELLLAHSRRQLLGSSLQHWLSPDSLLWSLLDRARGEKRRIQRSELALEFPDRRRHWVHIVVTPIDELLLLECLPADEAHLLTQQSESSRRAQAWLTVLRNLAHEIKNPLAGLRGAAQLLAAELPDAELREYTDLIQREADRLRNLVERLLMPVRQQAKTKVNIHSVLQEVVRLISITDNALHWVKDFDPSVPDLDGVQDSLIQLFMNLVQNAQEAGASTITLRTRVEHGVVIGNQRKRLVLQVEVIDNGPGVAPELMDSLFLPLTTNKEQGTGLGLSIVQTLAQQHEGTVTCESTPDRCLFRVSLPLE